jgi:hypothetical protein
MTSKLHFTHHLPVQELEAIAADPFDYFDSKPGFPGVPGLSHIDFVGAFVDVVCDYEPGQEERADAAVIAARAAFHRLKAAKVEVRRA